MNSKKSKKKSTKKSKQAKADSRASKKSKRAHVKQGKSTSTSKRRKVTNTAASIRTTSNAKDPGPTAAHATRRTRGPAHHPHERGVSDTTCTDDAQAVDDREGSLAPEDGLLFWLAALLTHVAERRTGTSWQQIVIELGRVHAVTVRSSTGAAMYPTAFTADQRRLVNACGVAEPPRVAHLPPT